MHWLLDPEIFNYVILVLYALNAIRWAVQGNWSGAFWITSAVTFGYNH